MPDNADRFLFSVEGLSGALRVLRFAGREGLSELFQVELTLASDDSEIEIDDVIGRPALLTMLADDGQPRHVHGMVSRFELGDAGKKLAMYSVTLVPKAWRLLHRHDCRIFQELDASAIIEKVLKGAGLRTGDDYRLSLQGAYRPREYCVQYRESDWAFVCRLMEEEGIVWFFEHHEDKHVLVLGDRAAVHTPIAGESTVRFHPPTGALSSGEHIHRFHCAGEVRPGRFTHRDYDFKKPALLLEGEASATDDGELEIYDYPGVYDTPQDGAALAKIRLEERQTLRRTGDGESGCERLITGCTFTLSEHTRDTFNREYLITRVEYQGHEPSMGESAGGDEPRYENRFQCIPSDVPFRSPRFTPKPTVKGMQTAIVVGPSGEEIHTDAFGRVKVHFHWDRLGARDDKSSCWVRVSQVWAGESWGAMHIPRVNQEVLVDFLEGDPDRPIVVGRVYHGTNVVPYGLPANKTRSTVKSQSTPGGGGSNELRFEDKKGSEEVFLHAQKDLTITVENDKNQRVGHDETLHVEHNRSIEVDVDHQEKIGNNRTRSVGNDEKVDVGKNRTITVGADHTEEIAGEMSLSIGKSKTEYVTADSLETVDGKRALTVAARYEVEIGSDMAVKVSGGAEEKVELEKKVTVGQKIVITCGSATVTVESNGNITIDGAKITVNASSPLELSGSKITLKASSAVAIEASGNVDLKGSGPMNIEASGPVKLKGAVIGINESGPPMLELKNQTPFPAALFPGLDKEGAELLTVVVKGTFGLRDRGAGLPIAEAQAPITRADVFHGEPGNSSVKYEADGCPSKRGTDVLLVGHARANRPVTSVDVSLTAGPVRRVVRVFGDRGWFQSGGGWEISRPVAFTRMPLVYERAFGGADLSDPDEPAFEGRNPLGVGFSTGKSLEQIEGLRLPNLEDPSQLITAPTDKPAPAGLGVLGRAFLPRATLAGTYDERWRSERCPFLPADFDERYFNCAAPELTSPRPFKGGEAVHVSGVTEVGEIELRVPTIALEVGISIKGVEAALAPTLDTLLIEPDEHRIVITWRATTPTRRSLLYVDWVRVRSGAKSA